MSKDDTVGLKRMANRFLEWVHRPKEVDENGISHKLVQKYNDVAYPHAKQDAELQVLREQQEAARRQLAPRDEGELDGARDPHTFQREFSNDQEKEAYLERIRQAQRNVSAPTGNDLVGPWARGDKWGAEKGRAIAEVIKERVSPETIERARDGVTSLVKAAGADKWAENRAKEENKVPAVQKVSDALQERAQKFADKHPWLGRDRNPVFVREEPTPEGGDTAVRAMDPNWLRRPISYKREEPAGDGTMREVRSWSMDEETAPPDSKSSRKK